MTNAHWTTPSRPEHDPAPHAPGPSPYAAPGARDGAPGPASSTGTPWWHPAAGSQPRGASPYAPAGPYAPNGPYAPTASYGAPRPSWGPPPAYGPASEAPARPAARGTRLAAVVVAATLAGGLLGGTTALTVEEVLRPDVPVASPVPADGGAARNAAASEGLDARAVAAEVLPGVVMIETRTARGGGTGSGFLIDDEGHLLTNAHVIAGATEAVVVTNDGRRLQAEYVGADPRNDVAVLRVDPAEAPAPLEMSTLEDLEVGDPVLAVGSPLGLSATVTQGIISAMDREVGVGDGQGITALQTDAPINPGNSGGALVDAEGRVVGMNTAIATMPGSSGNIGIGFAIPIDRALRIAEDLISAR